MWERYVTVPYDRLSEDRGAVNSERPFCKHPRAPVRRVERRSAASIGCLERGRKERAWRPGRSPRVRAGIVMLNHPALFLSHSFPARVVEEKTTSFLNANGSRHSLWPRNEDREARRESFQNTNEHHRPSRLTARTVRVRSSISAGKCPLNHALARYRNSPSCGNSGTGSKREATDEFTLVAACGGS